MENFSPANRAEISTRLRKQIPLQSNCRIHGDFFSARGAIQPGLKKSYVIDNKFQPGLKNSK